MIRFRSNGKLLLTGEYLVLDGGLALAIPTKKGQTLSVQSGVDGKLVWKSFDHQNDCWLYVEFELNTLRILSERYTSKTDGGSDTVALKLQEILRFAKQNNPTFLTSDQGLLVHSNLEFNRAWGLGSSSTLINNIADWSNTNPFSLQFECFGGSGYDIACAMSSTPIHYQLTERKPRYQEIHFSPAFKDQLYFIFLNQKQNSRDAISNYRAMGGVGEDLIDRVSELTEAFTQANSLIDFEKIVLEHEALISSVVKQDPIQKVLFSDYFGQTKSLGAWGGDFILATGNDDTPSYFKSKGYDTVIPYQEMAL